MLSVLCSSGIGDLLALFATELFLFVAVLVVQRLHAVELLRVDHVKTITATEHLAVDLNKFRDAIASGA
jgi:hypothetical protein